MPRKIVRLMKSGPRSDPADPDIEYPRVGVPRRDSVRSSQFKKVTRISSKLRHQDTVQFLVNMHEAIRRESEASIRIALVLTAVPHGPDA